MLKSEFEKLIGRETTENEFENAEKVYYLFENMPKNVFCDLWANSTKTLLNLIVYRLESLQKELATRQNLEKCADEELREAKRQARVESNIEWSNKMRQLERELFVYVMRQYHAEQNPEQRKRLRARASQLMGEQAVVVDKLRGNDTLDDFDRKFILEEMGDYERDRYEPYEFC